MYSTRKKSVERILTDLLGKFKQILIPIIFLVIAINIPLIIFINPASQPDIPPPSWSSIWIYYLHGDYDYFFRLRITPQTLPLWVILGLFLIQMGFPHRLKLRYDLLFNLFLGIIFTLSWMLLVHYIFIMNYSGTWTMYSFPLTPLLALFVVPMYRIKTRKEGTSEVSVNT
jgi:hypothetical protein